MIALKHLEGWAVQITRADGSKFFAANSGGVVTPVWPRSQRKYAVQWRKQLQAHNYNARVVPVTYAHPVEIKKQ